MPRRRLVKQNKPTNPEKMTDKDAAGITLVAIAFSAFGSIASLGVNSAATEYLYDTYVPGDVSACRLENGKLILESENGGSVLSDEFEIKVKRHKK